MTKTLATLATLFALTTGASADWQCGRDLVVIAAGEAARGTRCGICSFSRGALPARSACTSRPRRSWPARPNAADAIVGVVRHLEVHVA
jgi:hypothetical protein